MTEIDALKAVERIFKRYGKQEHAAIERVRGKRDAKVAELLASLDELGPGAKQRLLSFMEEGWAWTP